MTTTPNNEICQIVISVVTPAYNEERNLLLFYERIRKVMDKMGVTWEWIVVDDNSSDSTPAVLSDLASRDKHFQGYRLSKNFGSHSAIRCGIERAKGACIAVMASDLQDPPEVLEKLYEDWKKGFQVVWATRKTREGEPKRNIFFSKVYYRIMKSTEALKNIPAEGSDFFLMDRAVADVINRIEENHVSLFSLVIWIGFRQTCVPYVKQGRSFGRSGWTLAKKIEILVDSITSFTYFPIRLMSYAGIIIAIVGFVLAMVFVIQALMGILAVGWPSLIVTVLILGGMQMAMLGVLGEYLWRSLQEARKRPRYIVESVFKKEPDE